MIYLVNKLLHSFDRCESMLHQGWQKDVLKECLKLERTDIAALDSGEKSLISTQWSTLVVLAHWWCAAIDRRAAYLKGMGESQPTIILECA
jgi:hypothetical protein